MFSRKHVPSEEHISEMFVDLRLRENEVNEESVLRVRASPTVESEESAQSPVVEREESAQSPVVESEESVQSPVVESEESVQSPVVESEESAQSSVVESEESAQSPVVESEESVQSPVVESEESAQSPVVDSEESAQSPVVESEESAQSPVVLPRASPVVSPVVESEERVSAEVRLPQVNRESVPGARSVEESVHLSPVEFEKYFFRAIALPNQSRGQNQDGSSGKFRTKHPDDPTWRGLLRRLFDTNNDVVLKCECDGGKPKTKATTAIKHIERHHEDVATKEITLDKEDFRVERSKGISFTI